MERVYFRGKLKLRYEKRDFVKSADRMNVKYNFYSFLYIFLCKFLFNNVISNHSKKLKLIFILIKDKILLLYFCGSLVGKYQ